MHLLEFIGLLAAFLTTTAFFPQVIKTVKTKSTGDLSLPMYSLMFTGTICWLTYGLMKGDLPITLANAVSSLASFVIFYYKIKEIRTAKKKHL
jgi:MtN3 and saliva related transmembrane protein